MKKSNTYCSFFTCSSKKKKPNKIAITTVDSKIVQTKPELVFRTSLKKEDRLTFDNKLEISLVSSAKNSVISEKPKKNSFNFAETEAKKEKSVSDVFNEQNEEYSRDDVSVVSSSLQSRMDTQRTLRSRPESSCFSKSLKFGEVLTLDVRRKIDFESNFEQEMEYTQMPILLSHADEPDHEQSIKSTHWHSNKGLPQKIKEESKEERKIKENELLKRELEELEENCKMLSELIFKEKKWSDELKQRLNFERKRQFYL